MRDSAHERTSKRKELPIRGGAFTTLKNGTASFAYDWESANIDDAAGEWADKLK